MRQGFYAPVFEGFDQVTVTVQMKAKILHPQNLVEDPYRAQLKDRTFMILGNPLLI